MERPSPSPIAESQPPASEPQSARHSRRSFLKLGARAALGAGALTLIPEIAFAQTAPDKSPANGLAALNLLAPSSISTEKDPGRIANLTQALAADAQRLGIPDGIGWRTSNAWVALDGFSYIAFQGAILQSKDGRTVVPWNTLDQMHNMGFDAALDNGSLGVTIPPHVDWDDGSGGDPNRAFENRVQHFNIPTEIVAEVRKLRQTFDTGVFTSPPRDYGPYIVVRTQRMAFQLWKDGPQKGQVQRILVGDAAKKAGLIPPEAQLAQPDVLVGGGGKSNAPAETNPAYGITVDNVPIRDFDPSTYPQVRKQIKTAMGYDKNLTGGDFVDFFANDGIQKICGDYLDKIRGIFGDLGNPQKAISYSTYVGRYDGPEAGYAYTEGFKLSPGVIFGTPGLDPQQDRVNQILTPIKEYRTVQMYKVMVGAGVPSSLAKAITERAGLFAETKLVFGIDGITNKYKKDVSDFYLDQAFKA